MSEGQSLSLLCTLQLESTTFTFSTEHVSNAHSLTFLQFSIAWWTLMLFFLALLFSPAPNFLPFFCYYSHCMFVYFLNSSLKVILFIQLHKQEWRYSSCRCCSISVEPSLPFYCCYRVIMDLLFWHQFAAFASRWSRLLLLPGGLADMFTNPRPIWLHWFLCHA